MVLDPFTAGGDRTILQLHPSCLINAYYPNSFYSSRTGDTDPNILREVYHRGDRADECYIQVALPTDPQNVQLSKLQAYAQAHPYLRYYIMNEPDKIFEKQACGCTSPPQDRGTKCLDAHTLADWTTSVVQYLEPMPPTVVYGEVVSPAFSHDAFGVNRPGFGLIQDLDHSNTCVPYAQAWIRWMQQGGRLSNVWTFCFHAYPTQNNIGYYPDIEAVNDIIAVCQKVQALFNLTNYHPSRVVISEIGTPWCLFSGNQSSQSWNNAIVFATHLAQALRDGALNIDGNAPDLCWFLDRSLAVICDQETGPDRGCAGLGGYLIHSTYDPVDGLIDGYPNYGACAGRASKCDFWMTGCYTTGGYGLLDQMSRLGATWSQAANAP